MSKSFMDLLNEIDPSTSETIQKLMGLLDLKETMLAATLGVTERTLESWTMTSSLSALSGRGKRLSALNFVVQEALRRGVEKDQLLNLLDDPCEREREDSLCLLTLIVDDQTEDPVFEVLVRKQIDIFLKHNS